MKILRWGIPLTLAMLSGCASVPPDPYQSARACVRAESIRSWEQVGPSSLEVRDRTGQRYLIELRGNCPELGRAREIALLETQPMVWPPYARFPYGWRGYSGWGRPYGPWGWADPFDPFWVQRQSFFTSRICGHAGEVVAFPSGWGVGPGTYSCSIRAVYRLPLPSPVVGPTIPQG